MHPNFSARKRRPDHPLRGKDDVEVEYALRTKANSVGVVTYALQSKLPGELKGKLPTA
jgi:hypothetical protein